ncbi:MAG: T9SS type A sorting domain-containing protein [Flavobacteriales bacterium]|nr:T9SS type A sorting domain-containing protein [Flavobacteriales bacterium]
MPSILRPLAALSAFTLTASVILAQSWNAPVEVPDHRGTGGDIGTFNSLAIINGHPAIATVDRTHQCIRYVRAADAAGTAWGTPVSISAIPVDGTHLSLAEVNGRPAIAYQSDFSLDLMYVRANDANGDTWGTSITLADNGDVGKAASLAVVNGKPAIAYYQAGTNGINRLCYVRATDTNGTTWGAPVNPEAIVGLVHRTELRTVNGNPAIGFGRGGNSRYIRAADADGTTWNSGITIVTGTNNGTAPTLAVVGGMPCMAFHNVATSRLMFLRANTPSGDSWGSDIMVHAVSGQNVGGHARILDVGGVPAIVFQNVTNADLLYTRANDATGTTWTAPSVLAADGQVGTDISAVLVEGRPATVCYDATQGDLLFAAANNPTGTGPNAWNAPIHIDTHPALGAHTSLAMVNGLPALAYYDASNKDLRYIRAVDAEGTQWSTSITVDSVGELGAYCRLLVVNGRPAIAYFDELQNVRYVRANDANGETWGTPTSMDNSQSGPRGQGIALALIGGRPAIAYQNNTNGNVRYLRALDANGDTWPTNGYTLGSSADFDVEVALIDLNGRPAVAFNQQNGALLFTTGTNADFSAGAAVSTTVTTGFAQPRFASLAVVNGNPAVSYWSGAQNALIFARANTATGSTWGLPVTVDLNGGQYGVLGVHEGLPIIVHSRAGMRYAKASDLNGAAWGSPTQLHSRINRYNSMVVENEHIRIGFHDPGREQAFFVTTAACALNLGVISDGSSLTALADGAEYQWLDCLNDFAPIPDATGQTIAPPDGEYAVRIALGACVDTSACVQILSTDMQAITSSAIRLFPNPAHERVTISGLMSDRAHTVSLADITGRVVLQQQFLGNADIQLDLARMRTGAYLLRIIGATGITTVHQLVLE